MKVGLLGAGRFIPYMETVDYEGITEETISQY